MASSRKNLQMLDKLAELLDERITRRKLTLKEAFYVN